MCNLIRRLWIYLTWGAWKKCPATCQHNDRGFGLICSRWGAPWETANCLIGRAIIPVGRKLTACRAAGPPERRKS